MDSKERVIATIECTGPDKLPYLPVFDVRRFMQDRPDDVPRIWELIRSSRPDIEILENNAPPGSEPTSSYRAMAVDGVDQWGTLWKSAYASTHPLADNGFDLDSYRFPDPRADGIFKVAEEMIAANQGKYLLAQVWWTIFERMHLLRGFQNALIDYLQFPKKFKRLQKMVFDYAMALLDYWLDSEVDGIYFSDDWGDNKDLLIDPSVWRRLWKPLYRELFGRVRDAGKHVWIHSCGNVMKIVPDLVEIGLDVLNPIQPRAMDVEQLAKDFGGKLCFYGGIDCQHTLPHGTPDDVRKEVKYFIDTLGRFNGGYIGGVSHTIISDVPMENIEALYEAFEEYS
ncbi:hypothetical protein KJ567_04465 [Candidatus Bipolaricaulota bacterium]|nr:hypothetical protein [Candidatus Bipolaricaulota bacterium]